LLAQRLSSFLLFSGCCSRRGVATSQHHPASPRFLEGANPPAEADINNKKKADFFWRGNSIIPFNFYLKRGVLKDDNFNKFSGIRKYTTGRAGVKNQIGKIVASQYPPSKRGGGA